MVPQPKPDPQFVLVLPRGLAEHIELARDLYPEPTYSVVVAEPLDPHLFASGLGRSRRMRRAEVEAIYGMEIAPSVADIGRALKDKMLRAAEPSSHPTNRHQRRAAAARKTSTRID